MNETLPYITIGSPHNGSLVAAASRSISRFLLLPNTFLIEETSSVLTYSFNSVWCQALNHTPRPDYFIMHHADVEAAPYSPGYMIECMETFKADVISCVIALKDERGLTSTTIYDPVNNLQRRITLKELSRLPKVFGINDIPWAPPGSILCVNTGLWICKLEDWCEKICFHNYDYIEKDKNGYLVPHFWPEDWAFSIDCHKLGKKVLATSVIDVNHFGSKAYSNRETSLTLDEDTWHRCRTNEELK